MLPPFWSPTPRERTEAPALNASALKPGRLCFARHTQGKIALGLGPLHASDPPLRPPQGASPLCPTLLLLLPESGAHCPAFSSQAAAPLRPRCRALHSLAPPPPRGPEGGYWPIARYAKALAADRSAALDLPAGRSSLVHSPGAPPFWGFLLSTTLSLAPGNEKVAKGEKGEKDFFTELKNQGLEFKNKVPKNAKLAKVFLFAPLCPLPSCPHKAPLSDAPCGA